MKQKFETRAIHAGCEPDPGTGAIMTPIFQTSTYVQESPGKHKGYDYSRTRNPTRAALEQNIASLEEGRYGFAFASGMSAAASIAQLVNSGDHIICCDDVYGGTFRLFEKVLKQYQVECDFIDMTHAESLEGHIKKKAML